MHSTAFRVACRVVAIAFVAFALHRLAWMPWEANHVLSLVEARSRVAIDSGDPVTTAVIARGNIDQLRRISKATRDDANYYMLYAANAKLLGDLDLSERMYTAALDNADHRPEIYYERGLVYLQKGQVDAAVADLAHAAKFNPSVVYTLSGDLQQRVMALAGIK